MNRLELLKEIRDYLSNNLLCYSKNYLMTIPKEQYKNEWEETQEKLEIIEEMIEDEKQKDKNKMNERIIKVFFPDIEYYVRNSVGGLIATSIDLESAKNIADKMKKEYLKDSYDQGIEVYITNKDGKEIYKSKEILQKNNIIEETEEFE